MSVDRWFREVRQAGRRLAGAPTFSVTVLVVFLVAIGTAAAMSSLYRGTRHGAVPYPEANRLYRLFEFNRAQDIDEMQVSLPTLDVWHEENEVFEAIGTVHSPLNLTLATAEGAERLLGGVASPEMFTALRVQPVVGRAFTPDEGRIGLAPPSLIVSHELWSRRFGRDSSLIGRSLTVNGMDWTVVGVLPRGVPLMPNIPEAIDLWLPLGHAPAAFGRDVSSQHNFRAFEAIVRVKEGIDETRMREEVQRLGARMAEVFPETSQGWGWDVRSLRDVVTRDFSAPVRALVVGSLLLFAVAVSNVVGLFAQRARETVSGAWVRMTLGATDRDLRRGAAMEAALLVLPGTAAGLAVAHLAIASRDLWIPFSLPPHIEVGLSPGVGVAGGIAAVTVTWLSGLLTAAWWRRHAERAGLGATPRHRARLRVAARALLAVQASLAVVLTVVGLLTIRSLSRLLDADTGVRSEHLMTARVDVPGDIGGSAGVSRVADDILRAIDATPGVTGSALWTPHVPAQAVWHTAVRLQSRPDLVELDELPLVRIHQVGHGAATLLGLNFLAGRDFTADDRTSGRRVALVSETAAREWWGDETAVGRQIMRWNHDAWSTVVGVVRDAPLAGREGEGSDFFRDVFFLHAQDPLPYLVFLVRSNDVGAGFATTLRQTIRAVKPDLPLYAVRSMDDILRSQERIGRSTAVLGIVFAATALVLVGVGLYGVLATLVLRKQFEIGLRKALGATPTRIVGEVTGPIWFTLLLGAVAGLGVAWGAVPRIMEGALFEVAPRDVAAFAVAALVLVLAACPAILGPAVRGSAKSPAQSLRRGVE